ncbi:MAG: tetratricopeptide repeat protein [Saprospiraceae bacterium]|nr:tetratricopeptide repeat protein [Saprospiraceae bacterium]
MRIPTEIVLWLIIFMLVEISCSDKNKSNSISPEIFKIAESSAFNTVVSDTNFLFKTQEANNLNSTGLHFAKEGQLEKAFEKFNQAYEIEPENPVILTNLANLAANNHNYASAIELYNKAIEKSDSNYFPAIVSLSGSLLNTGDYQKSIDLSNVILKKDLSSLNIAGVRYNLFLAYVGMGNCDIAKKYFAMLENMYKDNNEIEYGKIMEIANEKIKLCN